MLEIQLTLSVFFSVPSSFLCHFHFLQFEDIVKAVLSYKDFEFEYPYIRTNTMI